MPIATTPTKRFTHIATPGQRRHHANNPQYLQRQLFADWLAARRSRPLRSPRKAFRDYLVDRNVFQHGERLTRSTIQTLSPVFGRELMTYLQYSVNTPTEEMIRRVRAMTSDVAFKGYMDGVTPDSPYYRPPLGPLLPPRQAPDEWELEEARKMNIALRTLEHDAQREHREQFAAWLGDRADVVSPRRMYKFWRGVAVEHPAHGWSRGMRPHARLGRDVHEQLGAKLVDLISLSPPIKRSLLRAILDPPPNPEAPACT